MACRFFSSSKEERFVEFIQSLQHCNLCSRLCERVKILSEANGNINSKVLFIAEAPGRLGADKTKIPLFGDKTGDNFEMLLGNIGWKRDEIFITNAILCNPRSQDGNNATPTQDEIQNCNSYLEMTINLLQPEVIITLGTVALDALNYITKHHVKLSNDVGKKIKWNGKTLIPLYHPGPRAAIHRSLPKQRADFISLAKLVDPSKGLYHKESKLTDRTPQNIKDIHENAFYQCILSIVQSLGEISYFKLTKLLYFMDLFAIERLGKSITGELYLRQQEGPWPPKLTKALKDLNGYEIYYKYKSKIPFVCPGPSKRFDVQIDDIKLDIIADVISKYGHLNNAAIKIAAYRSTPMHYVLEQEKLGKDMRKIPLLYKDKTIIDNVK